MDYFALLKALQALPEVIYIYGDDTYLVNDAVARIKTAVLTQAKDFNFAELDAKEQPIERVIVAAETLPMMAQRRLVLVRRAEEIKSDAADKLLRYLESPSPTTVLLLVGNALDSRTKLGKLLTTKKLAFQCAQLKKPQLFQFVSKFAKEQSLDVSAEVYDVLFDAYGTDLAQWLLALDRMSLFIGGPGRIDAQVAEALVFRTRVENVFGLTDAVLSGRPDLALPLAEELVQQKEAPLALLGLVARQVRQLLILREAIDRGESPKDHLRTAGIPPFAADKYLERARKVTQEALKRAHSRLADADALLKSSKLDPGITWFSALWNVMTA